MKEFIEKLIGRLEESTVMMASSKEFWNNPQNGNYVREVIPKETAIEIVNQLAEEYKPNVNSDIQEVIDNLEVYTVGRLNTAKVEISVLQLQRYINRLKQVGEEYKGGWITCSERLPFATGYYLVTIKGFNRAMYAWWINTERKWQYLNSQKEITEVIAWQPLPTPFVQK